MSGYSIPARPVTEDGYQFDSVLERDWAGFVAHTGLRWRQEPFAIRDGHGPTTVLNVVARPDFFLPDIAVIFECKPTPLHATAGTSRWRREAAITGLPVVVTESQPQARWMDIPGTGKRFLMPPVLSVFREDGPSLQTYFARCPDCTAHGLLSISESCDGWLEALLQGDPDWAPNVSLVDLWLSPCRHLPQWSIGAVSGAITTPYPRAGELG